MTISVTVNGDDAPHYLGECLRSWARLQGYMWLLWTFKNLLVWIYALRRHLCGSPDIWYCNCNCSCQRTHSKCSHRALNYIAGTRTNWQKNYCYDKNVQLFVYVKYDNMMHCCCDKNAVTNLLTSYSKILSIIVYFRSVALYLYV